MAGIDLLVSYSRCSVRQIDPEMVDQARQVFALPLSPFSSSLPLRVLFSEDSLDRHSQLTSRQHTFSS